MFFSKNVRVVIKNKNLAIETKSGGNLYKLLVDEGVIPNLICSGNGKCGRCRVQISMDGKNLPKPNSVEKLAIQNINLNLGYRLACQTTIKDNMTINTSDINEADFNIESGKKPSAIDPVDKNNIEEPIPDDVVNQGIDAFKSLGMPKPPVMITPPNLIEKQEQFLKDLEQQQIEQRNRFKHEVVDDYPMPISDSLLIAQYKGTFKYNTYSVSITKFGQYGDINDISDIDVYFNKDQISDYLHDMLKVTDIERVVIMLEEPSDEGDIIYGLFSYTSFNVGQMPCEIIKPTTANGDITTFLRLIEINGTKKAIFNLDKMFNCYYIADKSLVELPNNLPMYTHNMFCIPPEGGNPIISISDDLMSFNKLREFDAPDTFTLPVLLKVVNDLIKMNIITKDFKIISRQEIDPNVSLKYVVKIGTMNNESCFYLFRAKDTVMEKDLYISQSMLDDLYAARKFINNTIGEIESNHGNITSIVLATPIACDNELLGQLIHLGFIPKRYEKTVYFMSGEAPFNETAIFKEPDIYTYMEKRFGGYTRSE